MYGDESSGFLLSSPGFPGWSNPTVGALEPSSGRQPTVYLQTSTCKTGIPPWPGCRKGVGWALTWLLLVLICLGSGSQSLPQQRDRECL